MKIDRISYQKAFVIGPYLQEKIGFEIIVEEGEDPEKVLKDARELSNKMNIDGNPQLAIGSTYVPGFREDDPPLVPRSEEEVKESKERRIGLIEGDINSCGDLKVLESYRLIVKKIPQLQAAYEKKYSELTKKSVA